MRTAKLMRKQILVYPHQVTKLQALAKQQNISAAEAARNAIDAYNPDLSDGMNESELLALVSSKVKEAIAETRKTRIGLSKALDALEKGAAA